LKRIVGETTAGDGVGDTRLNDDHLMTMEVHDAGAEILDLPAASLQRQPIGLLARDRRPDDLAGRTPNLNKRSIWRGFALRTGPCRLRNNQGRHARTPTGTLRGAHGATAKKKRKYQCCVESWHMSLTLELSDARYARPLGRVVSCLQASPVNDGKLVQPCCDLQLCSRLMTTQCHLAETDACCCEAPRANRCLA
jgi:hypothetical protein